MKKTFRLVVNDLLDEPVFTLSWREEGVILEYIAEDVQADVVDWLDRGLSELIRVSDGGDVVPRHTRPNQPEFLPRLRDYIDAQFGFSTRLTSRPVTEILPTVDVVPRHTRPNQRLRDYIDAQIGFSTRLDSLPTVVHRSSPHTMTLSLSAEAQDPHVYVGWN